MKFFSPEEYLGKYRLSSINTLVGAHFDVKIGPSREGKYARRNVDDGERRLRRHTRAVVSRRSRSVSRESFNHRA